MASKIIFIFTLATIFFTFSNANVRCPTDIVYLVDQSTSITKTVYTNQVIPFLRETIGRLTIGEQDDHVSVIRFSSPRTTKIDFDFIYDQTKILDTVNQLNYEGGNTATCQALGLAKQIYSTAARKDDYKNKKVAPVAVIVTDGVATDGDAAAHAKKLIDDGKQIFAIGVGPMVSEDYLKGIAGTVDRVFKVADYAAFNAALVKTIQDTANKC